MNTAAVMALERALPAQRVGARLGLVLFVAGVTAAALFHALDLASRLAQTSDSAQSLVAGHAVVRGNALLSGWHLPLNDYYFTDTIPYGALEWFVGPRPFLLVLVPALTYALFVLAALLACIRPSRPLIPNLESGAAVALGLAAPAWVGSWDPVLLSGMHVATVLGALVALALCARIAHTGQPNAWLEAGAGVALLLVTSATLASDPFSLAFAFGPALAVLVVDAVLHPAARNLRVAPLWLGSGIALGLLLPWAIARVGGFTIESDVLTRLVAAPLFVRNLLALLSGALTLFGVNPFGMEFGFRTAFLFALHGAALVIVVAAFIRIARRLFGRRQANLFDRILCAGILSLLAACAFSAQFGKGITPQSIWTGGPPMRYLVPAVLFGAVLAGRQVPELLAALPTPRVRNAAFGVLVLLAALSAIAGGWLPRDVETQPRWIANNPPEAAARWLEQHGLVEGVGEYWSSNLVSAMSGDAVQVRSVAPLAGRLVPYVWVEDRRWFAQAPQFVIWQDDNKTGLTFNDVRATYPVCEMAFVAGYRIAVLKDAKHNFRCGSPG
jgi:hypothetical protein